MTNTCRYTRPASALVLGIALSGCGDLLDVSNPNDLTEESIQAIAAANAVVNGAVAANAASISQHWLGYLIATDEIVWIGSRDAWGQLDQGFIGNPANEFTDDAFRNLAQARWLADRAVAELDKHVAVSSTAALRADQARAYLHAGVIYTVIGESQDDFVISDKADAGSAIGTANMKSMLDQAITKLDKAVSIAQELNNTELLNRAQAMRARARHSRAVWDKIKPTVNTAAPLVSNAQMVTDAQAVIARAAPTWRMQYSFNSATGSSYMASEINSRGEQQFDTTSIVSVNKAAPKTILSVKYQDPIDRIADPRLVAFLEEWKDSKNLGVAGPIYSALTLTSVKEMRLLVAEDALARGDNATFTTQINAVRAMNGLSAYSGQISASQMLQHERRAALFLTGTRLLDMYRFGVRDPVWHANSDTRTKPGTLLPITCIERNSNPNLTAC
jgi:hypothetical protein